MKSIAVLGIAALATLWSIGAQAAGYPTESQFREALGDIDGVLRAEDMVLEVLDAQENGLDRPLLTTGLNLDTNSCLVFFNTRPEDGLTQFFADIRESDMPLLLRAMSVHEVAHCVEQREAYIRKHFDKVLPTAYKQENMDLQGYYSVVKSGAVETWGEALADIASLLYLKQTSPDRWLDLARRISAMRHKLVQKWPQHDTSAWLDPFIDANPDIAENIGLFDAAFLYRQKFRPNELPQAGLARDAR